MKVALTVEEQIELLKSKKLIISDYDLLRDFLMRTNYYRFSGYMKIHIKDDIFHEGMTSENLMMVYSFDIELKVILNKLLEHIEVYVKTQLTYYYALAEGPLFYRELDLFMKKDFHDKFISDVKDLTDNKFRHEDFIKHFVNANQEIPIWALVEILSFGTMSKLYSNLKPSENLRNISNNLIGLKPHYLKNYLHCLTAIRNICAHRGRIYGNNFKIAPKLSNSDSRIPNLKVSKSANKIFIYIFIMMKFLGASELKKDYINVLDNLFNKYSKISIGYIGFPENWKEIL